MGTNARDPQNRTDAQHYQRRVEPPSQGGMEYDRCTHCGAELLVVLGGRRELEHADGCPLEQ